MHTDVGMTMRRGQAVSVSPGQTAPCLRLLKRSGLLHSPRCLTLIHGAAALIFAAHSLAATAVASEPAKPEPCALASLSFETDLPRLDVEKQIAAALGKRPEYSAYANNLRGGVVRYETPACTLVVTYRPGAPAALLATPDGKTTHRQPRDESVLSHQLLFPANAAGVR